MIILSGATCQGKNTLSSFLLPILLTRHLLDGAFMGHQMGATGSNTLKPIRTRRYAKHSYSQCLTLQDRTE